MQIFSNFGRYSRILEHFNQAFNQVGLLINQFMIHFIIEHCNVNANQKNQK